jgi:AraC-like DNA-binding protein
MGLANFKMQLDYFDTEDFGNLKECFKQLSQIKTNDLTEEPQKNFSLLQANILNSMGDGFIYFNQRNKNTVYLDSASYYYTKAYTTLSALSKPNPDTEALYRMRQVNILSEKKDYELALFYLNRYDSLFRKYPNYMSSYHYTKAIAFKHLKKYDSAIFHSQKYLSSIGDKNVNSELTIYTLDNLASIYYEQNKSDSALKYSNLTLKKYKEIEEKKRKTSIKIHADELDEIKRFNEKLIQNSEESNLFEYSIIVIILLTSSIILFYKNKRVKSKEKKKRKDIDTNLRERILIGLSDFELSELFLDSKFTINLLAEHLETNSTYLSTIINNDKEKTFKQYLAELRINYAIQKLKNDRKFIKYSISAIAEEVGYTNASAFTRIFKKQTGKTPSEFIKLINLENSTKANK